MMAGSAAGSRRVMRRTPPATAVALAVVVAAAVTAGVLKWRAEERLTNAAESEAVQAIQRAQGSKVKVERSARWGDCAIVQVGSPRLQGGVRSAVVLRDAGHWRVAAVGDESRHTAFDPDDANDAEACRELANSRR